jgi:serine/threonine protein kinase
MTRLVESFTRLLAAPKLARATDFSVERGALKYPAPFGRHLLLERINVGGMAEVFKAKSFGVEGFERIVAVKRILPTMAEDQEFITMFVDEARIASHLTHQNIVQIYELAKWDGNYYISMEYIAGRDLRQLLDHHKRLKKPMEIAKACYITSRVCEALEYAHRKKDPAGKDLKIIHRDVSPQNVIISFEGEVKLCDFGIAKAASRASRTQVGVLKGKFAYMSPEQVRGQPTDRRSDLFALGVIFYEMLTGERLFLGESDYSTLEAVRAARVPAPAQLNTKIPAALEGIMLKLLARDPKDRYQWASEVHEDLLDHLSHEGKIYHGRHLRAWMQDVYARDIEIENAKLEEFMKLKLPEADAQRSEQPSVAPIVAEMAEQAQRASVEGIERSPKTSSVEAITNTTADKDIEALRHELDGATPSQGVSGVPEMVSPSPVSHLFGTPSLDAERSGGSEDSHEGPMVRPAAARPHEEAEPPASIKATPIDDTFIHERLVDVNPTLMSDEEPGGEDERTQFDVLTLAGAGGNDTLFENSEISDNQEETVGEGRIHAEIRAAQSELIDRLESQGALDNGETVDASESFADKVPAFVFDPTMENSITSEQPLPDTLHPGALITAPGALDDKTSISPVPLDDPTPAGGELVPTGVEGFEAENTSDEEEPAKSPPPRKSAPRTNGANGASHAGDPAARTPAGSHKRRIWEINADHGEYRDEALLRRAGRSLVETPKPGEDVRGPAPSPPSQPQVVKPVSSRRFAREIEPLIRQQIGRATIALRDPRVLMLVAASVGMLAIALLVTLIVTRGSNGASLHIVTEPTRKVEVKLDGKVIGNETPVEAAALKLGQHTVELHAQGYHPYRQVVQIAEAKPHTMVVPLEVLEAEPAPPPTRKEVEPPKPTPDDEVLDHVPTPVAEAKPARAPEPIKTARPAPAAPEPKAPVVLAKPKPPPKVEEGYLVVTTKPTGVGLIVDGKQTNLKTPVRHPYAVSPGKHVLTFVMDDGQKYSFEVQIAAGETTKVYKPLR